MKNTIHKPDGLIELEELSKDLLKTSINGNSPFSIQIYNNIISKLDIIIRILKHSPRLPFYQIENEIIKICKIDNSTHGVVLNILFTTKFEKIDTSRLSYLKVNV